MNLLNQLLHIAFFFLFTILLGISILIRVRQFCIKKINS